MDIVKIFYLCDGVKHKPGVIPFFITLFILIFSLVVPPPIFSASRSEGRPRVYQRSTADRIQSDESQNDKTQEENELENLKKQIEEETTKEKKDKEEAEQSRTSSGALNLNRLNPEISLTGDVIGFHHTNTNALAVLEEETKPEDFTVREIELAFVSMLDPYSRMKVFLSYEDGEVSLEEGYAEYLAIPGGFRVSIGKQYQQVGLLNRWHQHAFPQVDRPPVLEEFLGKENLSQTGVHLSWLLPKWLISSGELTVEALAGDAEPFAGNRLTKPAWSAHLNNYQDVSSSTFIEFGGSAAGGLIQEDPDLSNRIYNVYFRFNWTPMERAKYRGLDIWGEGFVNKRTILTSLGERIGLNRKGGFVYVEYRLNQRLLAGIRADYVERLDPMERKEWWLTPVLTLWQSEWVRIRAQYSYIHTNNEGVDHRFMVQLTWAAGPHKHETY